MNLEEATRLTTAYGGTAEDMGAYFRWKVDQTAPEDRPALQAVFAEMWITWRLVQDRKTGRLPADNDLDEQAYMRAKDESNDA